MNDSVKPNHKNPMNNSHIPFNSLIHGQIKNNNNSHKKLSICKINEKPIGLDDIPPIKIYLSPKTYYSHEINNFFELFQRTKQWRIWIPSNAICLTSKFKFSDAKKVSELLQYIPSTIDTSKTHIDRDKL
jgi:hypothetical protein